MHLTTTFIHALLPLAVLAGKGSNPFARRVQHIKRAEALNVDATIQFNSSTGTNPPYRVQDHYEGESFFNDWTFFTGNDPTHGLVNYQSRDQALKKKLAYVQGGVTTLTVDSTSSVDTGEKRDSVRITTKKTWNRGLFIADFAFMPHGCSVWPAYWSVGPQWPTGGEIDILEGVHNQPKNQYTLHTAIPCDLPADGKGLDVTGNLIWHDCQSYPTDNRGCGFSDPSDDSYGAGFNNAGGGVLAHEWNSDHVKIWRFPRDKIPGDIKAQKPNPSTWGAPVAAWPVKYCNISKALQKHSLILDITLCGDWAGPAFSQSGCPGTCEAAVADPANVVDAKWGINYITVYQS